MTNFKLLDEVVFSHVLHRISEDFKGSAHDGSYWRSYSVFKSWVPRSTGGRTGFIIGRRVLYNGRVRYGNEDTPTTFENQGSVPCYLVVEKLNRAPVYVLPEHLKLNELLKVTHPYVQTVHNSPSA